jgi:hypothetical protein
MTMAETACWDLAYMLKIFGWKIEAEAAEALQMTFAAGSICRLLYGFKE